MSSPSAEVTGPSDSAKRGLRRVGAVLAILSLATACRFGLDYSGDESGLELRSLELEHERELSYLVNGNPEKPRVIFVHGSPGSAVMYADYLHELADEAQVFAVDRLGYEHSSASGSVTSFAEQAASIEPLLVRQGDQWPIVVGHSLGGPIAARIAADYPDRVGAVVIVAGGLDPELEEPRWYNEVARWRIVQPFLADFLRVSNHEMWAAPEEVRELDPLLDRITCPTIVIHGTQDSLVPFESIRHTVARMQDNEHLYVIVLIGEDHSVTKLRREEVRETIEELLEGLSDPVEAR